MEHTRLSELAPAVARAYFTGDFDGNGLVVDTQEEGDTVSVRLSHTSGQWCQDQAQAIDARRVKKFLVVDMVSVLLCKCRPGEM